MSNNHFPSSYESILEALGLDELNQAAVKIELYSIEI